MKKGLVAIVFYMMGIMVFLTIADLTNTYWKSGYYIWDKAKDCLFILSIYDLLPKYRKAIRWAVIYTIIRLVWEPISIITGISVNSSEVVRRLFTMFGGALLGMLVNELWQWRKVK